MTQTTPYIFVSAKWYYREERESIPSCVSQKKGLQQAEVVERACNKRQECDSGHHGDCEENRDDDDEGHGGNDSGDKDGDGGDSRKIVGMVVMSWQGNACKEEGLGDGDGSVVIVTKKVVTSVDGEMIMIVLTTVVTRR